MRVSVTPPNNPCVESVVSFVLLDIKSAIMVVAPNKCSLTFSSTEFRYLKPITLTEIRDVRQEIRYS